MPLDKLDKDNPLPPPCDRHIWQFVWVRDLFFVSIGLLLILLAYQARTIAAPMLVGIALAYVFNPVVTWADRKRGVPRWFSAGAMLTLVIAVFSVFLVWVVPRLVGQVIRLITSLPKYARSVAERVGVEVDMQQIGADAEQMVERITRGKVDFGEAGKILSPATDVVGLVVREVMHLALWLVDMVTYWGIASVIVAFTFFFFCWKWGPFLAWAEQFIPRKSKSQTLHILKRMDGTVSGFIRGRLVQGMVMAALLCIGWWATDVPYWLLLGLAAGLLNLAPFAAVIGWIAALVLAAVDHIAGIGAANLLAQGQALEEAAKAAGIAVDALSDEQRAAALAGAVKQSFDVMMLVWPTLVYMGAQLLDGWVIEPIVQGQATDLDPLTVLVAVLVGGTLAGVVGLLLAIPVTACAKILAQELVIPRLKQYAQES